MGLAASQARFLAITSRKMNCEFQSMQIAQEKLSVTRDLQKASQEYQNSLSATKLVWDTEDNTVYDLSYDVMMTPSMANDYNPYLVTDTKGKIVLSTSMFQAAVDAGVIDAKTGDPKGSRSIGSSDMSKTENQTNGSRNAFLYQLGVKNQVTPETVTSIINLGNKGYSNSGIGGEALDKTIANAFNTNSFITYMKNAEDDDGNSIYALKVSDILANNGGYSFGTSKNELSNNQVLITKSGSPISESEMQKLTLGELLSGQYELTGRMDAEAMRKLAEAFLKSMGETLGYKNSNIGGLNVDDESNEALNQAMEFTLKCLNKDYDTSSGGGILSKSVTSAINQAASTNSIVAGSNNVSSVSLTNMLKSFLTNFAVAIEGFGCGYYVTENDKNKSTYVTDDIGYQFLIKNDNTSIDEKDVLMAENPRKALEYEYGKKWWENEDSLSYEGKLYDRYIIKYGSQFDYRNIRITDEQDDYKLGLSSYFYDVLQAGLEPENISKIYVLCEYRWQYNYGEDVYKSMNEYEREFYIPVGEWSEWKLLENGPYIVYTVNGRWYCMYTGD